MRIAFIHEGRAMLPEIGAYTRFFESKGHLTCICIDGSNPDFPPDVEWHFMGFKGRRKFQDTLVIHEYASASVPPLASFKNKLKRSLNDKPDFRIFLNEWVKEQLAFKDHVRFGLRDMGVWVEDFASLPAAEKTYDFIYPGSLHPYNYFKKLLTQFSTGKMKKYSLLVLSGLPIEKRQEWKEFSNIHFKDPVAAEDLRFELQSARFGINCRPPGSPYDFQTSSKLLEYGAAKLPVVSTGSTWLTKFMKQHGGQCYLLEPDFSNFDPEAIERFNYEFPDITGYDWEQQINRSGVYDFLISRIG